MITTLLSNKIYENDVYPLVKAFYPEEMIKVYGEEEFYLMERKLPEIVPSSDHNNLLRINFEETKITIHFKSNTELGKTNSYDSDSCKINSDEIKSSDSDYSCETNSNETNSCKTNSYEIKSCDLDSCEVNSNVLKSCDSNLIVKKSVEVEASASKSQYKNTMKRSLYTLLSCITKKELPWGILTGIRPTKLVYEMLVNNEDDDTIRIKMKEEFYCSEDKISMSIRIAKRELELLRDIDYQNGYSLYIGIPFCPSTCLYCSFTSYSLDKFSGSVENYLNALEKEIIYGATCFPGKKLTTVYFGGGTPTTLSAEQLDRILGLVKKYYDFTHVREFCVEAGRPDSITKEKLEVLKKWGVDRISINPQSMQQKTLDLIGRKHTVEQIKEAFHLARETGHDNINMDIIIGLPGENLEDVTDTLKQIHDLNPESLTVHTLALKRAARLNLEKDQYKNQKASNVSGMLDASIQFAENNEYLPYYLYRQKNMAENLENIGYSRYGKEGLYNILIMEEQQTILALGAGGMSKFVFHEENRIERVDNVKSITDYIGRIDEMIDKKKKFLLQNSLGM